MNQKLRKKISKSDILYLKKKSNQVLFNILRNDENICKQIEIMKIL